MKTKLPTQRDYVRQNLLNHGTLNPLEALREYGIYRLGAINHRLRHNEQMPIATRSANHISRFTGRPVQYAVYVYNEKPQEE